MPKSKSVRKGKSRSRKLAGNPAALARGFQLQPRKPLRRYDLSSTNGLIAAALDHDVVTCPFVFIDDTPTVRQSRAHIRSFSR